MENIKRDTIDKVYLFSVIGIIIFFIPIKINNQQEVIIYHLSYFIENRISSLIDISIIVFVLLSVFKDLINYKTDNISKFKILMKIFSFIMLVSILFGKDELLFMNNYFIVMLRDLMSDLTILLPISSLFMPFLLNYGLLEITEAYTHRTMNKLFNVSGKVFLIFLVCFLVNSICGAFLTYRLYKDGKLREKEAVVTILNFSILSLNLTKDLCYKIDISIIKFIIIELIILIICNFILSRIYPIKKKKQSYYFKSNHKNVNCKRHKMKTALKKYNENKNNKSLWKLSFSYLNDVIYFLMDLLPVIVFIFFICNIIYKLPLIIEIFRNITYIVIHKFNLPNDNLICDIISFNIFSNILAIKNFPKDIYYFSKVIMGLLISLQCISICFLIPFIKNSRINISIIEIILVIIERFFIILFICCIFFNLYLKYII